MKACIRHPGFEEEIVEVKDLSRGGLSFISSKGYIEGSRIEVAVPYSKGKQTSLSQRESTGPNSCQTKS
jgi:hypothetical protein